MQHPKIIGLAVIAVFAMSAAIASAAQAAPLGHVETAPAIVTGEQTVQHEFITNAGTVTCKGAKFTGTVSEKTFSTLTLSPEYTECTAFGFAAQVKTTGCKYVFHIVEGSSPPTATVDVSCEAGKKIEVIAGGGSCNATVESQTGLKHIILSNAGSGTTRDVNANITVTGIKYTLSGFLCPGGTGTFTNGEYKGGATLRAYQDLSGKEGAQQGAWVE